MHAWAGMHYSSSHCWHSHISFLGARHQHACLHKALSAPGRPPSRAPWPARWRPRWARRARAAGSPRRRAARRGSSARCRARCTGCTCPPAAAARAAAAPGLQGRTFPGVKLVHCAQSPQRTMHATPEAHHCFCCPCHASRAHAPVLLGTWHRMGSMSGHIAAQATP